MYRKSIWDEMRKRQERMDAMFDNFFWSDNLLENFKTPLLEDQFKGISGFRRAVAEVREADKEIITEIEIPGIDKKDIQISVTDDGIEVKAESRSEVEHKDEKKGVYKSQRSYSGFYRQISLPPNVDSSKAVAEYKNGVLRITVPKLKIEQKKKKLLEIK